MTVKNVVYRPVFPILPVLFLIFLTLKLTGHIDWSWWMVTAPLWIPFAIFLPLVFLFLMFAAAARFVRR